MTARHFPNDDDSGEFDTWFAVTPALEGTYYLLAGPTAMLPSSPAVATMPVLDAIPVEDDVNPPENSATIAFVNTRWGNKPAEKPYFSASLDGTVNYGKENSTTPFDGQSLNIVNDGVGVSGEQFRDIAQRNRSHSASNVLAQSDFVAINDPGHTSRMVIRILSTKNRYAMLTWLCAAHNLGPISRGER